MTFDSKKTDLNAILKKIALAGYDNPEFLAPTEAYAKLPGCCKYERAGKPAAIVKDGPGDAGKVSMKHHAEPLGDDAGNNQPANKIQAVFNNYFLVKDALVKSEASAAAASAAILFSALERVEMGSLSQAEHVVWMNLQGSLKLDAKSISEGKDIAIQRRQFSSLSTRMYELMKASKHASPVYYQHCPMYNNNEGANWLSKEAPIKNPYYGSSMLTCGKTVETLK